MQCSLLEIQQVLLDIVAISNFVLRRIQRLYPSSAGKNTDKNVEMSAMSADFKSGESMCYINSIFEQNI